MTATIERAEALPRRRPTVGVRPPAPLCLALVAFLLYLAPAARVVQLSPDAVEYVDIARRLVAGEGYRLGIKAYHFGGTDVLHDGLAERAPLFPLLAAGLFRLGLGLPSLQVANAMLAALSVALICAIGSELFDRQTGTLAGVLAAASPVVLVRMVPPMTEALAISLSLLATWLVIRFLEPPRWRAFLAAGAALGLGYLARPTTVVLIAALLLGAILASRRKRPILGPAVALLAGVSLFAIPMSLYSLVTRGSASYSGQSYLYAVFKTSDVLRNGYLQPLPSPAEFVSANRGFVVAAILENASQYAGLLFLDGDWLLWLMPAWPIVLLALMGGAYSRHTWPVLLLAAANFLVYTLTWSAYSERYQLLTLLLLLPFAVDALGRLGLRRLRLVRGRDVTALHAAILAVVLAWSPAFAREYRGEFRYRDEPVRTRTDRGLRWTGPPRWVQDNELSRMVDWVNARTGRDEALAHGQPWPFTFFTERPATLLPTKLSPERLRSFLIEYRVAWVLLDTRDRDRRGYQPDLEALAPEGVGVTSIGSYRVFDTRPLWRERLPG